jgi:hypothetical protein
MEVDGMDEVGEEGRDRPAPAEAEVSGVSERDDLDEVEDAKEEEEDDALEAEADEVDETLRWAARRTLTTGAALLFTTSALA